MHLGGNPLEHVRWYHKRLGKVAFDALEIRANTPVKRDRKAAYLIAKKLLEEVKKK
jgi:hypothetical protein